jgi:hypothetical protein
MKSFLNRKLKRKTCLTWPLDLHGRKFELIILFIYPFIYLFFISHRSRLGCQVKLTPVLEGMRVTLPSATRNMAVDGFKPKPH